MKSHTYRHHNVSHWLDPHRWSTGVLSHWVDDLVGREVTLTNFLVAHCLLNYQEHCCGQYQMNWNIIKQHINVASLTPCFFGYLTALFQLHWTYSIEWDRDTNMNGKQLRIWKETVLAYLLKYTTCHLYWQRKTMRNVMIISNAAKIWTKYLMNTNLEHCCLVNLLNQGWKWFKRSNVKDPVVTGCLFCY